MSKSKILVLVVVLVVVAGGVFSLSRRSENVDKTPAPATPQESQSASDQIPTDTDETSAEGSIDIKNMMFTPPQITVKTGGKVTWTNNDDVAHTITIDQGNGPDSDSVEPGSTYSFTFDKAGSYQYHCDIHPSMRGTIVVK